jgi:hypothetical protein
MIDYKKIYDSLLIGQKITLLDGEKKFPGIMMDKYLKENNVMLDVRLDDGKIIESFGYFKGDKQNVEV